MTLPESGGQNCSSPMIDTLKSRDVCTQDEVEALISELCPRCELLLSSGQSACPGEEVDACVGDDVTMIFNLSSGEEPIVVWHEVNSTEKEELFHFVNGAVDPVKNGRFNGRTRYSVEGMIVTLTLSRVLTSDQGNFRCTRSRMGGRPLTGCGKLLRVKVCPPADTSSLSVPATIGIVAAVLLVVGGGVPLAIFLYKKRPQNRATQENGAPGHPSTKSPMLNGHSAV